KRRADTDGRVARSFASMRLEEITQKLLAADIAFGRVSDCEALSRHPHLRRIMVATPTGPVSYPAPAAQRSGAPPQYGPVPALGEHTEKARKEFGGHNP
ncbi:MAG: CoA transferase, partial [Acetobacteraceae bacterium]|nr:CoA transferase [Acetobacteraceae bacterium]